MAVIAFSCTIMIIMSLKNIHNSHPLDFNEFIIMLVNCTRMSCGLLYLVSSRVIQTEGKGHMGFRQW